MAIQTAYAAKAALEILSAVGHQSCKYDSLAAFWHA